MNILLKPGRIAARRIARPGGTAQPDAGSANVKHGRAVERAPGPGNRASLPGVGHGNPRPRVIGYACAAVALLIWSSWFALTRLSVTRELGAADIVALRIGGGALVLLPSLALQARRLPRRAWREGVVLSFCWGAPFVLLVALGIQLTSAAHAAALTPGTMPVFAGLFGWAALRERLGQRRLLGFAAIIGGVAALTAGFRPEVPGPGAWAGNAALLAAAALWSVYTLRLRRSGLTSTAAAALVCLYSAAAYLPVYALAGLQRLSRAPAAEVWLQALYQGVLVGGLSVVAYNQAISRLGPGAAAVVVSLVPVMATLLAIPVLGEWPTVFEAAAVAAIAGGVFLSSRAQAPAAGP